MIRFSCDSCDFTCLIKIPNLFFDKDLVKLHIHVRCETCKGEPEDRSLGPINAIEPGESKGENT